MRALGPRIRRVRGSQVEGAVVENDSHLRSSPPLAAAPPSPTDLIDLAFARTALVELLLLAVAGGLLSGWIVLRRLAFFTHATGTATFPGLVLAEAAGFSPRLAALAVAGGYAGAVGGRRSARGEGGDTTVALVLVAALAAGVVLAGDVFSSGAGVDSLLFGSLLGVQGADLAASAAVAALAVLGTFLLGPAWAAAGFDRDAAGRRGRAPSGAPTCCCSAWWPPRWWRRCPRWARCW